MENSYFIAAFATFGSPNGFQQRFWDIDRNTARAIPTFDLDPVAIQLYPGSKVYALRKISANGRRIFAYSLYSHAKEPHSQREGTFIGSSILFVGQVAEENITLSLLDALHDRLEKKHVRGGVISVPDSSQFVLNKHKDFDKIRLNLRETGDIDFSRNADRRLAVWHEAGRNALPSLLKTAIGELLDTYGTIYFTESTEVARYVRQKNMFPAVNKNGFDTERKRLAEERKRKEREALEWFEREKILLNDARKQSNANHQKQYEAVVRAHEENEQRISEYKEKQIALNQSYKDLADGIDKAMAHINNGKRPEDQKRLHEENKRRFVDALGRQEKPVFMDKLPKMAPATDLTSLTNPTDIEAGSKPDPAKNHSKLRNPFQRPIQHAMAKQRRPKTYDYRTATWALLILWIGTLAYFTFFGKPKEKTDTTAKPARQEQTDSLKKEASSQEQTDSPKNTNAKGNR